MVNVKIGGTTYSGVDTISVLDADKEGSRIAFKLPEPSNDVLFLDYDGSIIYQYSKEEFLALSAMPANPDNSAFGLVAEGWNWTLEDAQDFVEEYGKLDIAQTYATSSGYTEFIVVADPFNANYVSLSVSGEKDWGDGTVDSTTSHQYSSSGLYTVKMSISQMTAITDSYGVIAVRFMNLTSIADSALASNYNLDYVCFSKTCSCTIGTSVFMTCTRLKFVSIPSTVLLSGDRTFKNCYSMDRISIPKQACDTIGNEFFMGSDLLRCILPNVSFTMSTSTFRWCGNVNEVIIPSTISSITDNMFSGCSSLKVVRFTSTAVDIGLTPFTNCYALTSIDLSNIRNFGDTAFSTPFPNLTNVEFGVNASITNGSAISGITNIRNLIVRNPLFKHAFEAQSYLKSVTWGGTGDLNYPFFRSCNALETVNFTRNMYSFASSVFSRCSALRSLYFLSNTEVPYCKVGTFGSLANVQSMWFYVPSSLYSDWSVATNWAKFSFRLVSM